MTSWLCLPLAAALDWAFGDPQFAWHPVRLIGGFTVRVERAVRRRGSSRLHGCLAWTLVVGMAVVCASALLAAARRVHPAAELVVSATLVYFTIAPRDLARHAHRVEGALRSSDLIAARSAVGHLVGRDTDILDATEVSRAAVEAVAESTVDGVTAPLFYACLFGPLGAVGYRAINTLDSMWGHHDELYEHFGWASARADDLAGLIPARLTLLWIAAGAALCGLRPIAALRIAWRDARKHQSPNSGIPEAAFAGALGIVLGGRNRYAGVWSQTVTFGSGSAYPDVQTIHDSVVLMLMTTLLCTATLSVACLTWQRCWL